MDIEQPPLSAVLINPDNPRTCTEAKFQQLINSLLALPKMLEMRPIVVDENMMALGGNMRQRALSAISEMTEQQLIDRLSSIRDIKKKTDYEKDHLKSFWLGWLKNPTSFICRASNLTEAEKREFIIKDNASFGDWDTDALANNWDNQDLKDWGADINWEDIQEDEDDTPENPYSSKVATPQYEPTSEVAPQLGDMLDDQKTRDLIQKINDTSDLTDEERSLLTAAAYRHQRFNYQNIAEFYAHARPEVQALMEKSALVIIDYEDALANGFVALTKQLAEITSGLQQDDTRQ